MITPQGNKQQQATVTPFTYQPPQTPRTDVSQASGTPKKFQSPGSAIRDLTKQLEDHSMKTPPKEELNATINPQSKRKL